MGGRGRAEGGGKREGPRDAGGGGCRGSSRSGSSLLLAHSFSVPGAGCPARGGSQLPLLPGDLKPLRLWEIGPRDWLAQALGAPRKQVDGWVGSAGTRASGRCGCIGPGCGFQSRGGGFAAPRLTFHQLRGSPDCPDQVRALEGEFGEGTEGGWLGLRERPGVYARRGEPRLGQARVLRPQSGRSGCRASTCRGKTQESRCGCPEEGTCGLCTNLGSSGREPF